MSVARRLLGLRILLGLGDSCEVLLVGGFAGRDAAQSDPGDWAVDICSSPRECAGKRYDLIYVSADNGLAPSGSPLRYLGEWLSRLQPLLNDSGYCCVGFRNRWSLKNLASLAARILGGTGAVTTDTPGAHPLSVAKVLATVARSGLQVHEVLGAWPDHHSLKFIAPRNGPAIDYLFNTLQAGAHRSATSELLHRLAARAGLSGAFTDSYVIVAGDGRARS